MAYAKRKSEPITRAKAGEKVRVYFEFSSSVQIVFGHLIQVASNNLVPGSTDYCSREGDAVGLPVCALKQGFFHGEFQNLIASLKNVEWECEGGGAILGDPILLPMVRETVDNDGNTWREPAGFMAPDVSASDRRLNSSWGTPVMFVVLRMLGMSYRFLMQ